VYWANRTKAELEKQYPGMKVIVKTASSATEQANQVQDLQTVNKIDTLVILPFESAPLTKPVAQVKSKGVFVTVVDRGLTDTERAERLRGRRQPGLRQGGRRVHRPRRMGGKGNVVILRGIPDGDRQPARGCVQCEALKASYPRHQGARRQARQLEPRRRLQGDAGLPHALQADRCRVGLRRRHGRGRAEGHRAGQARAT
jgi:ABC-type sugar transport system substrate-binding protein